MLQFGSAGIWLLGCRYIHPGAGKNRAAGKRGSHYRGRGPSLDSCRRGGVRQIMVRHDYRRDVWLSVATLAAFATFMTHAQADSTLGIELIRDSTKGNCSICHLIPGIGVPEDAQGNIGPALEGVGERLSPEELTERIVDARRFNPETLMPPYGTVEGLI